MLGLADRFIVTGESISMLTEVVRRGKPLAIYPLPSHGMSVKRWFRQMLQRLFFARGEEASASGGWRQGLSDCLVHLGLAEYRRDFLLFHQQLMTRGVAVRFGTPFLPVHGSFPDEMSLVIERIQALFEKRSA
jgi:uncharacterized protein